MEKILHIAVPVGDITEALEWYRDNFDIQTVYSDDSWALLRFDNIALALVLPDQHPPHFAVARPDAERFGPLTPHRDGTASVYIRDPWDNAIEIMQDTPDGS